VAQTSSYCVDGTNIVRGAFGYGGPQFRPQEEADSLRLISALSRTCERVGERVEIDLFFDGGRRSWDLPPLPANLCVRFTGELSADDLILDRVRARGWASAGRVTVATSDGELGRKVGEEGGKWLRVKTGAALESLVGAIERSFCR
jgi:hypothetical protein